MDEAETLLWLTLCPGLHERALSQLLRFCGSAVAARDRWLRGGGQPPPEHLWRRARDSRWVARCQPEFPERLRHLPFGPYVMYYLGSLEALQGTARVAVVGTRQPTPSGQQLAGKYGFHLGANGASVISGLARGVDSAAHAGSLRSPGSKNVAVVACGLDRCYPRENMAMFQEIARRGLVLSEYPPGTPPERWRFPARNRLMAALAEVVVVVEAPRGSGSLITVRYALELGRQVFAVPGALEHPNYVGNLDILQEGGAVARSPQGLAAVALGKIPPQEGRLELGYRPEEWCQRLGVPLSQALVTLGLWEAQGLVVRGPDGRYGLADDVDLPKILGSKGIFSQ